MTLTMTYELRVGPQMSDTILQVWVAIERVSKNLVKIDLGQYQGRTRVDPRVGSDQNICNTLCEFCSFMVFLIEIVKKKCYSLH